MEATTMISAIVGYLAKKLKDNKSINNFFDDFTETSIQSIRPLFLKEDDEYDKIIEDLLRNPDSPSKRGQVEMALASHVEDNPDDLKSLTEMYNKVREIEGSSLDIENLKAKQNVDLDINQAKSSAKLKDIESGEGTINVKIDQK